FEFPPLFLGIPPRLAELPLKLFLGRLCRCDEFFVALGLTDLGRNCRVWIGNIPALPGGYEPAAIASVENGSVAKSIRWSAKQVYSPIVVLAQRYGATISNAGGVSAT